MDVRTKFKIGDNIRCTVWGGEGEIYEISIRTDLRAGRIYHQITYSTIDSNRELNFIDEEDAELI